MVRRLLKRAGQTKCETGRKGKWKVTEKDEVQGGRRARGENRKHHSGEEAKSKLFPQQ